MRLPPLTDEELTSFLPQGLWIAKLATHGVDGSVRMTPLHYAVENGTLTFSTWENSEAARNLRDDPRASVLIDKPDQPYKGVHYTGHAHVQPETSSPEQLGETFARYMGGYDECVAYFRMLASLHLGNRVTIRFRPDRTVTWDLSKV
jgi:PPOX class probable F420-dependent enzyme